MAYIYIYIYIYIFKYHTLEITVAVLCVTTPYKLTATVSKLLLLALHNSVQHSVTHKAKP
jgi:hypothetical protein